VETIGASACSFQGDLTVAEYPLPKITQRPGAGVREKGESKRGKSSNSRMRGKERKKKENFESLHRADWAAGGVLPGRRRRKVPGRKEKKGRLLCSSNSLADIPSRKSGGGKQRAKREGGGNCLNNALAVILLNRGRGVDQRRGKKKEREKGKKGGRASAGDCATEREKRLCAGGVKKGGERRNKARFSSIIPVYNN